MIRKMNIRTGLQIQGEITSKYINRLNELLKKLFRSLSNLFVKKLEIHILIMGLLLGRAMILNELSPFAIPFFAVMYQLKRSKLFFISLAILFGSNLAAYNYTDRVLFGMIIFLVIEKWLEKKRKIDLTYSPFIVAIAIFIPQIALFSNNQANQFYPWIMTGIESLLGFILTLIFVQAMPILIYKRENVTLNQEEIIALTIVLASVMSGTVGWTLNGYLIENMISRYFILIFALAGGSTIGATIGVVTGLILSLSNSNAIYQISLLAFAGLLAGLLKQANKIGVTIGFLLGTAILSVYIGNQDQILQSLSESIIAIIFFLLTPNNFLKGIAKFVPGTNEYHHYYQDYITGIRNITSKKIEQFANMFSQLANSFQDISISPRLEQNEQVNHFINHVTKSNCDVCWKRKKCWDEEFFKTYNLITELMTTIESKEKFSKKDIPDSWSDKCVKSDQIAFQLLDIYESYSEHLYWKTQLEESRLLVAHQLFGVSQVMKDLATEINKGDKELKEQEQQIKDSLEMLGLSIRQVNVINLDEGNVEIEVIQPTCNGTEECTKVVAPLLSEVVGENIIVSKKECYGNDGSCKMCLKSAKNYDVGIGYASAAKDGKWLSGDSFSTIEIGNGKYAIALSDGMGNGERAQKESKTTLELLRQLLRSGFDETFSIKTINSVLLLRSQEDIFSTLDLAIIDLFDGYTKFLKVGSTPSFIKRQDEIFMISASNLPVGIIQDIDIDSKEFSLKPGDLLVMLTDGIYDSPKQVVNKELWMKRMIQEIETNDPQEFADLILEKVVRDKKGVINDDMTVIVAKIEENKPDWSTIKIPGISRIEREKKIN
ncbi:stage II sporulation protein E [Vulcanibacillus modesticaldus]|uniref:Stage II sporulation protein E n=1 Tax=Vulcanibacillus modesticaldus TaxID=337097 RepID=A0A1D2YX15_9BACI|nr:stage II sporulation protein E [Vulcanibacillus modesticaldus]OEG00305.1 stage II sporulation protein E [Vulcanibacillus modesticaldus]